MTPAQFRTHRHDLGLTQAKLAAGFRVTDRCVRQWESGDRAVSGPAAVLMEWLVTEQRPV